MLGGNLLERAFAQHAHRRAAGGPAPVVLVGAEAAAAWIARWEGRPLVKSIEGTAEACARGYLRAAGVRSALSAALSTRIGIARTKRDAVRERTTFERDVWLAVSRDALIAADDLDAQLLLGCVFADEGPSNALRALAAATRVLAAETPPLLLSSGPSDIDAVIRAEIELAEAAPVLPLAVSTTARAWEDWLHRPAREHAKAMVRPYVVDLRPTELCRPETPRALLERAKRTRKRADDDAARSVAERLLFEALERAERSQGLFELNRRLKVRFGNRPLEIDLSSSSPRLAIEVDGYFHFGEPGRYRRDRRKDLVLQKEGYLVMRFLAEDVITRLAEVVSVIHDALPKGIER